MYCRSKRKNSESEFVEIFREILGGWPVMRGNSWKSSNFDWKQADYKLVRKGFTSGIFFDLFVGDDPRDNRKKQLQV